jgi:tetratricopeptide (TPR) repeat protein
MVYGEQLNVIGQVYRHLERPDEAMKCFQEALAIFQKIGAASQVEITLSNIEKIEKLIKQ